MPARLDLTWKPSADSTSPPVGKARAIYRGDTYGHTIRITDGWTDGLQDGSFAAQIRRQRLKSSTAGDPLVAFSIVEQQDGDDLLVVLGLEPEDSLDLPSGSDLFWDLQTVNAGVVTTLLAGTVKVLDDVTRVS